MGLNLSNQQIAAELDLSDSEVQAMTSQLREGIVVKKAHHGAGEFARDEDSDGFCEVHVNTLEGFWSLLRSWLRPHRGVSQEKLPWYLGLFELVYNLRQRGKALLHSLVATLVAP
jgi:transposase-like protein